MKYDIQFTNQFKKDLKLAKKQNKNLDKLFEVIDILANGGTLDAKYRDHDLTGNYKGTRECHIEPDWLLIYEICGDVLVLMLYRLGSHSQETMHLPKTLGVCEEISVNNQIFYDNELAEGLF